jgi:hypothetical protein
MPLLRQMTSWIMAKYSFIYRDNNPLTEAAATFLGVGQLWTHGQISPLSSATRLSVGFTELPTQSVQLLKC